MNWFRQLTGFAEQSPDHVRSQLRLQGRRLTSLVNGNSWDCGEFSAPMLQELRDKLGLQLEQLGQQNSAPRLRVREQIADVLQLHADVANAGALFQVASQFNLLEMVSPQVTPEQGVGIYGSDQTQGPACAIACGAGTIWRNYFMPLPRQIGQTATLQFDALAELGRALGNENNELWQMSNGYVLASQQGLEQVTQLLQQADESTRDALTGLVRIGIQSDAQVTLPDCRHQVSQVYCSALPVAYSPHPVESWREFACLILDAAYEATLYAAMQNLLENGQDRVFLTLLGGGVFGNEREWIMAALRRALLRFAALELDVVIVSHGRSNPAVRALVDELTDSFAECKGSM